MLDQIERWKKQLSSIQQEIDSTVKSDWDKLINQDIEEKTINEDDVLFRESVRYRRHIVQLLDSIDDNLFLCSQVEKKKAKFKLNQ